MDFGSETFCDGVRQQGGSDSTAGSERIDLFEIGESFEWGRNPSFASEGWGRPKERTHLCELRKDGAPLQPSGSQRACHPPHFMPKTLKRYYGQSDLRFITFSCHHRLVLLGTARARDAIAPGAALAFVKAHSQEWLCYQGPEPPAQAGGGLQGIRAAALPFCSDVGCVKRVGTKSPGLKPILRSGCFPLD